MQVMKTTNALDKIGMTFVTGLLLAALPVTVVTVILQAL